MFISQIVGKSCKGWFNNPSRFYYVKVNNRQASAGLSALQMF